MTRAITHKHPEIHVLLVQQSAPLRIPTALSMYIPSWRWKKSWSSASILWRTITWWVIRCSLRDMLFGRRRCWAKTAGGGDLSPRRPGFDPRSVYLKLVVDKLTLENVYLLIILLSPVSIIPTVLHTHIHIHIALTIRTKGRSLRALETAMFIRKLENTGQKSTFTAKGKLRSHTNWCVLSRYCVAYSLLDKT